MNFNPFRHLTKESFLNGTLFDRYENTFQTIFGIYVNFPNKHTLGIVDYLSFGIPQANFYLNQYLEKKLYPLAEARPVIYSAILFTPTIIMYSSLLLMYLFSLIVTGIASFFVLPIHGAVQLYNYFHNTPTNESSPAFKNIVSQAPSLSYNSPQLAAEKIYPAADSNVSDQGFFAQSKVAITYAAEEEAVYQPAGMQPTQ